MLRDSTIYELARVLFDEIDGSVREEAIDKIAETIRLSLQEKDRAVMNAARSEIVASNCEHRYLKAELLVDTPVINGERAASIRIRCSHCNTYFQMLGPCARAIYGPERLTWDTTTLHVVLTSKTDPSA